VIRIARRARRERAATLATKIEVLAELQRVDQSLRENTMAVESRESRVAELEKVLSTRRVEAADARDELTGLTSRQHELEEKVGAVEHKMKDRRMRLTRIRNDKELGIAKREMEILKDEAGTLETDLLELMQRVEESTKKVQEFEAELTALGAELETEATALRETKARVGGQIEKDRARRKDIVGTVDETLRRRYEMIFSRRGGLAVVAAREGTCRGCHMNLPPQLFNQIQRNADEIFLCPSCQRLLYWEPEVDDSED
jgi:uncharacterized protein